MTKMGPKEGLEVFQNSWAILCLACQDCAWGSEGDTLWQCSSEKSKELSGCVRHQRGSCGAGLISHRRNEADEAGAALG